MAAVQGSEDWVPLSDLIDIQPVPQSTTVPGHSLPAPVPAEATQHQSPHLLWWVAAYLVSPGLAFICLRVARVIGTLECILGVLAGLTVHVGMVAVLSGTNENPLQPFVVLVMGTSQFIVFTWQYIAGARKGFWSRPVERIWRLSGRLFGGLLGLAIALGVILIVLTGSLEDRIRNRSWRAINDPGMGYAFEVPGDWQLTRPFPEGFHIQFTSDEGSVLFFLRSLHIDSVPEGVNDHKDWMELYFLHYELPIHVESLTPVDCEYGSLIETRYRSDSQDVSTSALVLNFMNYFQDPSHRRIWIATWVAEDEDFFESATYRRIRDSIHVKNYVW
jgi:hypothetical protein